MILNRSAVLLDGFEPSDISALLLEPGGIYRHPGYFFVVNAIFHEAIVFLGNCSSVCKSNIWRFTELTLCAVAHLLEPRTPTKSVSSGSYTTNLAHPQKTLLYMSDLAAYESLVVDEVMEIKLADLRYVSQNPEPNTYRRVFIIEPSSARRGRFEKRIASRRVFEFLWEKCLWSLVSDKDSEYLYDQYRTGTTVTAAAGWIFEFRMRQLLRKQQKIRLFSIIQDHPGPKGFLCKGYPGRNPVVFQLIGSN